MSTVIESEVAVGLHKGVPALTYHRWPGASQTLLKKARDRSFAHVRWEMLHPQEQTDAMIVGAAVHTAVLEPDQFGDLYDLAGQCEATKKGDGQRCSNTGTVRRDGQWFCNVRGHDPLGFNTPGDQLVALRPAEYQTCSGVRDAIAAHPIASLMIGGEREASAVWVDEKSGVLCRGRFDVIDTELHAITDLKTTTDASPMRFRRTIYDLGYHIQAAHYIRGAQALGLDVDSFGIIAVEKEPPYAVAVYQLEGAAIYDGGRELDALLERWAECERTGIWPAYDNDVVKIDLPAYAPKQINERLGE